MNKVLCRNKIKNKKYHTIEIVLKPNIKLQKEGKSIPITHKYMTAHCSDLLQAFL